MTIIFRVLVGVVCDILGARRGLAFLLFLACPGIVGMMSASEQEWVVASEMEFACTATQEAVLRSNWASRFRGNVIFSCWEQIDMRHCVDMC